MRRNLTCLSLSLLLASTAVLAQPETPPRPHSMGCIFSHEGKAPGNTKAARIEPRGFGVLFRKDLYDVRAGEIEIDDPSGLTGGLSILRVHDRDEPAGLSIVFGPSLNDGMLLFLEHQEAGRFKAMLGKNPQTAEQPYRLGYCLIYAGEDARTAFEDFKIIRKDLGSRQ